MDYVFPSMIEAINESHKAANDLYPQLIEAARPFIGRKIQNKNLVDECVRTVVEKEMEKVYSPYKNNLSFQLFAHDDKFIPYFEPDPDFPDVAYGFYCMIACAFPGQCRPYWHYTHLKLGHIHNQILTEVTNSPPNFRYDFTQKEIYEIREKFRRFNVSRLEVELLFSRGMP